MAKVYATGRRKTAIAKVWLENGNGQLTINGQSLDQWLGGHDSIKKRVMQPLHVAKQESSVNIIVKTLGGGYSAQADAARHGISRALVAYDEQFRTILKPHGLLTRDARSVEKKNTERKKQENLLNSQNVNFFNFDRNLKRFSEKDNWKFQKIFLLYLFKGSDFIASFFMPNILAFYITHLFIISHIPKHILKLNT